METTPCMTWLKFLAVLLTLSCAESCDIGTVSPSSHIGTLGTENDTAFFLQGAASTCCGVLKNWKFHASATGTLRAHLWRETTSPNYELIAEDVIAVSTVGYSAPTASSTIEVKIGDIVGWDNDGMEIIPHSLTSGTNVQSNIIASLPVGSTHPWDLAPDNTRTYAFGAVVTPNTPPVITDSDVTHPDTTPAGTPVTTIAVTDADMDDLTIVLESHASFTLDETTREVKTVGSVAVGVYTLEVTAEDNCETATGTVTVTISGVGPIIDNLDATHGTAFDDDYDSATNTWLYQITVTDTDPDTCTTTNPKFTLTKSAANAFELYLVAGADLNYDVNPSEVVDVECTDVSGLSDTRTYTVPINDKPPTLTGLPNSITIDDETIGGTALHTFTCDDSDDTTTASINPANPLFDIIDSSPSFEIQVVGPLNFDSTAIHTLTIECSDARASVTDTYTVTLTDKPPVVTDLPGAQSVNDGAQDSTTPLGSFTCTDGNDVCTCSVDDTTRFEIQGAEPDFELRVKPSTTLTSTESPITLQITCTDGTTPITENFIITVDNTVPVWDTPPGTAAVPLPDNTLGAFELGSFTLLDPDTCTCVITAPASHPYELQQVTTNDPQEWKVWTKAVVGEDDIDYDDAASVDLTIECDDGINPAITGTFTVSIEDVPPDVQGLPGTDYSDLSDTTNSAVLIDTFTVVDNDDNDRITCKIDPAYTETNNFEVVLNSLGPPVAFDIKTISSPSGFDADSVPQYILPIQCNDQTNPVVTKTKTVNMINSPPTFVDLSATQSHGSPIPDSQETDLSLVTFNVQDNNLITCVPIAPAPYDDDFQIDDSAAPEFQLVLLGTNSLHFDTDEFVTCTIECTDGTTPIRADYTIQITDAPPVVTNLPGAQSVNDGAQDSTTPLGSFTCTDGNDVCTCSVDDIARFEIQGAEPEGILARETPGSRYQVGIMNTWKTKSRIGKHAVYKDFQLRVKPSTTLTSAESPITLQITCTDGTTPITEEFLITVANTVPVWDTPPGTAAMPLPDNTLGAVELGSFTLLDPDTCTCVITAPASHPYELQQETTVDPQEWKVWTKTAVDEDEIDYDDAASVDLTIECDDGINPAINGTFTVSIEDVPPDVQGLPGTDYSDLSDTTNSAVLIDTFTVVDNDDNDRITCKIDPAYTETSNFEVVRNSLGPPVEFAINTISSPSGFDADSVPQYVLPIQCNDQTNPVVTKTKTVNMINSPPTFVDLSATQSHGSPIPDSQETDLSLVTFNVQDNNPITCVPIAPAPYDDDFQINDSAAPEFQLVLLGTNSLHFDTDEFVTCTIECTDGTTPISANYTIQITDAPPILDGLPGTDYEFLSDDTTVGFMLDTFTCTDSDDLCNCNIDPTDTAATNAFEIKPGATDEDFEIWVKDNPVGLDASVTPNYTIPIECTDGNKAVTDTKVVQMMNAPPVFQTLDAAGNVKVQVSESDTIEKLLYNEFVDDTTSIYCYRTDPKNAPGILLEMGAAGPPSTELIIKLQNNPRLDFESGSGTMSLDLTCEDKASAVTRRLTIEILNAAPVITNPGESITLSENLNTLTSLHYIQLEEFDKDEPCTLTDADGGPFAITDDRTIQFTGASSLDFETKASYTLHYQCTDGAGLTTTDTFTVNVQNEGPKITNTEKQLTIREDIDAPNGELLLEFATSEEANSCYQTTSETDFLVKLDPGTSKWGLYFKGGATKLNPDIKYMYTFKAQCMDDSKAGPEKIFYIKVLPNDAPTFTNIEVHPSATKVEVVAKETMEDDEIFQIESADAEGDKVSYKLLSCDPPGCPFEIVNNTGQIIVTEDLATHRNHRYTLSVEISDAYNTPEPRNLVVVIKDPNTIPTFRSLPKAKGVLESRAVGSVIHTITKTKDFTDPDDDDIHKFYCNFLDGGDEYFSCDEDTGEIKIIKALDYETQKTNYHVEITVNDGYEDSVPQQVKINIFDDNEEPKFEKDSYTLTHDEGKPGDEVGCPEFNIKDPDGGDIKRLFMNCPKGDGAFVLDDRGCVLMTREWDLDAQSKRLGVDTITCTVTVKDIDGLKDTATLTIKINEIDDIAPVLDSTQYSYCAPVGSTSSSFSVSAVDNDVLAEHKDLTYEIVEGGIVGVNNDGTVTIGDVSNYPVGTSFTRTLRVSDQAGNYDTAIVDIVVCDPPPVVVNTNNNNNNNAAASSVTSSNDALYWLIPAGLLLALMAGLLAFLCWRCWRNGKCGPCGKSRPKQPKVTKVREAAPRRARTPSPTPQRRPAGTIPLVEQPITHHWARNVGNLGHVTT